MASLASLMINLTALTHRKKDTDKPKMVAPIDVMPDWAGELQQIASKVQTTDEMKQLLMELVKSTKAKKTDRSKIPPLQFTNKKKDGRLRNNDGNLGNDNQRNHSGTKDNDQHVESSQRPPG